MPVANSTIIQKHCEQCGNAFIYENTRKQKFCSVRCYKLWVNAPEYVRFKRFLSEPTADGCILWTGARNTRGYGTLAFNNGLVSANGHRLRILAHRLAWIIVNGPIDNDTYVLHRCDNPPCVNVEHLFIGTRADNNSDMMSKGRMARGEMCNRGVLTNEKVRNMRAEYQRGNYSQREIGRMFGVAQQTVQKVISRKTWTHV